MNLLIALSSLLFVLLSQVSRLFPSRVVSGGLRPLPHPSHPVTILIPVFNKARYLRRALLSAMNQSLADLEILVVDDSSTDGSSDIIAQMMSEDARIRVIHLASNLGTHVARIKGVESARGDFILSLDPDDVLLPFIAEDSFHCALLHGADVVEFEALDVLDNSVRVFDFLNPVSIISSDGTTMAAMFSAHELNWNLWKRLIQRSVYLSCIQALLSKLHATRLLYTEDKLHFGMLLLFTRRYYYLRQLGYVYHRDNLDNSEAGTIQSQMEAVG
jgi:glycosyltransferase involved in cell wall biosynthesis